MSKIKYLLIPLFFLFGFGVSYFLSKNNTTISFLEEELGIHRASVIGFLPYWLLGETDDDYSKYLTNLTYFGLAVDGDGAILKKSDAETEPGWAKFDSENLNSKLTAAKKKGMETSLLIYAADTEAIDELILNPETAAQNLVSEIIPLMRQYGYTDLDVDLETLRAATVDEQLAFTKFLKIVSDAVKSSGFKMTICLPVAAFSYDTIIDPVAMQPLVDRVVIMTYDYFYRGSAYTGPNAPLDEVESVIKSALVTFKSEQIILGVPLYGYTWETLKNTSGSPIIPSSGETFTQKELAELLESCTNCEKTDNEKTAETLLSYKDEETGSYHLTYYPDDENAEKKMALVKNYKLGGVAFWALGYESGNYLKSFRELQNYYWQDTSQIL